MDIINLTAIVLIVVLLICSAREQYVYSERKCSGKKRCELIKKTTYLINVPVNSVENCKKKLEKHDEANSAMFSEKKNKKNKKHDCMLFKDTFNESHVSRTTRGGNKLLTKLPGARSDMTFMSTFDTLDTIENIPLNRPGVCERECEDNDKCAGSYLVPDDKKGKTGVCILKATTEGASPVHGTVYVKKNKKNT